MNYFDAVGSILSPYRPEDRLTSIRPATSPYNFERYLYDGLGRRTVKIAPSGAEWYYFYGADGKVRYETDNSELGVAMTYFNGQMTGRFNVGASDGAGLGLTYEYPFYDHLGTARLDFNFAWKPNANYSAMVLTPSTATPATHDFFPFGGEVIDTASSPNPYKFTGKERDAESGLDNFGARYYGSNMGRFMSPDWSAQAEPVPYAKLDDPQSLNLYSYVGNNPLIRIDSDGHCWPQWLCNFVVEAKNKLFHGEFTTDTSGAKIHQLVREDARNSERLRIEELMKTHPPEIRYGGVIWGHDTYSPEI